MIDNVTRTMYSFDGNIYYIIDIRKDIRYCIEKELKDSVSMTFQPRCAHSFKKTTRIIAAGITSLPLKPLYGITACSDPLERGQHHTLLWPCQVCENSYRIGCACLCSRSAEFLLQRILLLLQFFRRIFQYIMRTTSLALLFQKILLYQILDISYCCIL